jgi:hypothetical protein
MSSPTMIPTEHPGAEQADTHEAWIDSAGGRAGQPLTFGRVAGRSLRWMRRAGGGVFLVGAAGACCGGLSLGLVAAAGATRLAAGLGAVFVALASAVGVGLASVVRRRAVRPDSRAPKGTRR